jgi:hypothetical protein
MKKLIVISITAVLSVLVITVLAQTEGGQQGSGVSGIQAEGQESTKQRYLREIERRRERSGRRYYYGRSRNRTRDYDGHVVRTERRVSGSMQDIVNYLMEKDEQNTQRIEALEATVAKLEAELKRNSGIERAHWSKVGELEDKVKLLVRAERKRRRAEGGEEEEGLEELEGEEEVESGEESGVVEEAMEETE